MGLRVLQLDEHGLFTYNAHIKRTHDFTRNARLLPVAFFGDYIFNYDTVAESSAKLMIHARLIILKCTSNYY